MKQHKEHIISLLNHNSSEHVILHQSYGCQGQSEQDAAARMILLFILCVISTVFSAIWCEAFEDNIFNLLLFFR